MDKTRFASLTRVFGVSADRRGAVRTVAGGAAALAALAAGGAGAKKKKKKKPKPAPEPQAFAVSRTTAASFANIGEPTWQLNVSAAYYHPASLLSDNIGFGLGAEAETPPDELRALLVQAVQDSVSSRLADQGWVVPAERIAVTIL